MVKISGILSLGKNLTKSVTEASHGVPARVSNPLRTVSFCGAESTAAVTGTAKKLPETAKFYSYPQPLQKSLTSAVETLRGSEKTKNLATFLDNLMVHSSEPELIVKLLEKPQNLHTYAKSKSILNKMFQNVGAKDFQTKEQILENLALMVTFNPESFKVLQKSKGFKEILANRLNLGYLAEMRPIEKIDENYFYNLFERLEKVQSEKLSSIKGLDKSLAAKVFKAADEQICKDPEFSEKILEQLSKNPELTNRILKRFEPQIEKSYSTVLEALEASNAAPEVAEKLIQMNGLGGGLKFLLKNLSGEARAVSDDILDYYIKLNQSNPEMYPAFALNAVNCFEKTVGKDEHLVKTILEKAPALKNSKYKIDDVLFGVNENNIGYLKHNLSIGKFDEEMIAKLRLMRGKDLYKEPSNWAEVDKVYNETYLPVHNAFAGKKNLMWPERSAAQTLAEMRLYDAESFQKVEELGLVELIKEGKVNPRVLSGFHDGRRVFTPEVLADLKMLKNNESIIKKFDNFDKIFAKTKEGDVISVNGQLYLNLGGRIERWNMSEEKFNELFPLVDRFTATQGKGDCYLITALDALYRNPKSRATYYKMFEQAGDDICVTIPAYKDFSGKVMFPKGEIQTSIYSADGAKHVQMLEQTYARTALRSEPTCPVGQNPLTTDDLFYLSERNCAGHPEDVMKEVLMFNNNVRKGKLSRKIWTKRIQKPEDLQTVQQAMEAYGNNPRFIFNITTLEKGCNLGHALQVRGYNPETKKLSIVDPRCNGLQEERTVDELKDNLYGLYTTILA